MTTAALLVIGAAVTLLSGHALWCAVKLPLIGRHAEGALIGWKRTFHEKYLRTGHHVVSRRYFPVVAFEATDGSRHTARWVTIRSRTGQPAGASPPAIRTMPPSIRCRRPGFSSPCSLLRALSSWCPRFDLLPDRGPPGPLMSARDARGPEEHERAWRPAVRQDQRMWKTS
ncbi:MAG: hypothetical protein ISP49_00175 [Reyranella sp.]|nr:hypothetical protein [Reyranella sp.]